ncbi:MAG: N-methyl-L-tryptophan oxidase [Calditrichia bacterium]
MQHSYDILVLGLGGMGSAIAYELSKRGVSVGGVEQFEPLHNKGGTHGESRIIRKAYPEKPDYVPLLNRSYELWDELEQHADRKLRNECGFLVAGHRDSPYLQDLDNAYQHYPLTHERWSATELAQHFPQFNLPEDYRAYFDPFGGFLYVDRCLQAHQDLAVRNGATLCFNEKVRSWQHNGDCVVLKTDKQTLHAKKLIIASGAWMKPELAKLDIELRIWRRVIFWYGQQQTFSPEKFPSFVIEHQNTGFYGLPALGEQGVKIGEHNIPFDIAVPEDSTQPVTQAEEEVIERCVWDIFPMLGKKIERIKTCLYAVSPDRHFILDHHPEHKHVLLAGGFSGHGYKFATAIGEVMADLALEGKTKHPIDFLSLKRFQSK